MKYNCFTLFFLLLSVCSFAQIPSHSIPVYDSTASKGYYFLAPTASGISGIVKQNLILDKKGSIVYYQPFPKTQVGYDFKIQPNGLMSYYENNKYYIMDSTFKKVDSVICEGGYTTDIHELQILPNGHYLLMGEEVVTMDLSSYPMFNGKGSIGSSNAAVTAGIIQELDQNKNVVFEWHAKDYFAFDEVDAYWLSSPTNVDWTHFNAVAMDTDGNILVSSRHFNQITKINRKDSSIIWRFGGKNNQFTFTNDSLRFYGQHDIRRIANGHLTLYDNGNYTIPHGARAVEYEMDEVNKTVKLVWSYTYDTSMVTLATGNVQRLPNGNTLIDNGLINKNKVCFSVVTPAGNKVFELDFDGGVFSYRAFNYLTLPWKLNRPKVTRFDSNGTTYLAADTGYSSYLWSNGSTSRVLSLNSKGTYSVFVPYGEGYIGSEEIDIPTNPCKVKATMNGNFTVCASSNSKYISGTNIAPVTHYWKITGGSIITDKTSDSIEVNWGSSPFGSLTLIETNSSGCVDSVYSQVVINPLPKPIVIGPDIICSSYSPIFDAAVHGGSTYLWKVSGGVITSVKGASSMSANWSTSGTGKITLYETSFAGCTDSIIKTVSLYSTPSAAFTGKTNVCKGGTDQYSVANDSNASYDWAVSGGTIVSGQHTNEISVNWTNTGTGSVSLGATGLGGCSDSSVMPVDITAVPRAHFTVHNVCLGQSAMFVDSSSDAVDHHWEFGDGNTSTVADPSYNYSKAGNYFVSLSITSQAGCLDSIQDVVTVYPLPEARWSASSNPERQYNFKANDSLQLSYDWNFGDGFIGNTYNASHQYTADGTYEVKLTVNSHDGCQATFDSSLLVKTSSIVFPNAGAGSVSIFPNPSAQYFNIQYTIPVQARVNITVYDMQGREIAPLTDVNQQAGTYTTQLDAGAHSLPAGMYMLRITIAGQMINKPIIISH